MDDGASRFTGRPKQPTIWVYQLNSEGEYIGQPFRDSDRIASQAFPDLYLTAAQIFESANPIIKS